MRWILFSILSLCSSVSFSQHTADSLAIMTLIQNDYATYETLDIEAHRKNCTIDYILIENGEIWSIEQEAAYMKSLNEKSKRINQFDKVSVTVERSFAYVVYELKSQITRNNITKNYQWTESVVLRKQSGAWKIALIHSTKVKEW